MYQPEDDYNVNSSRNPDSNINREKMDANLSPKNVAVRKKQLEKIFTKLIAIGLSIGAVLGVGTYYLLNKLGLTKKPYQIEQEFFYFRSISQGILTYFDFSIIQLSSKHDN